MVQPVYHNKLCLVAFGDIVGVSAGEADKAYEDREGLVPRDGDPEGIRPVLPA
jgi:hypothetical protein